MAGIEQRLQELGLTLPTVSAPAANYVPYNISGNQVFLSGTLPIVDGELFTSPRDKRTEDYITGKFG